MVSFFRIPLLLLALSLSVVSCKKDNLTAPVDNTSVPRTLGEFIENNYDLSLLHAALEKAGLIDTLKQAGAFTMYAPDNAAFNAVGIVRASDFDRMNTDSLRFILKYHIMKERYFVSTFPSQLDNQYKSLAGPDIYVSIGVSGISSGNEGRFVFVNGTMIMPDAKRNISMANGVLHILGRPLNYTQGSVQDYIAKDTSLTVFSALMKKFGYWDGLKTQKTITAFAPSNEAFGRYKITVDSIGRMTPERFQSIAFGIYTLQLHPAHIFSTDAFAISGMNSGFNEQNSISIDSIAIYPSYTYNNYYKREETAVYIKRKKGNGDWINNPYGPSTTNYYKGRVLNADHVAENGIVHIVDQLFINPALMLK